MSAEVAPPVEDSAEEARRRELAYLRSADPWTFFGERLARGPIAFDEPSPDGSVMVLSRGAIEQVLRDTVTFSNGTLNMGGAEPVIPVGVDPPIHAEYRRLLDPAFSPRRMAALEPSVTAHANRIIDRFIDRGWCDFSDELAVELPCLTFLDLLGLPHEELPRLILWKDVLVRPDQVAGSWEAGMKLLEDTAVEIHTYLTQVIADRRAEPRDDLITMLTTAEIEGGRRLDDSEIIRCLFQMIAAGLDTVTISLQCILHFLAVHPQARRMLVDDPDSVNNVIEELLRWESPVQSTVGRLALVDTEVGGCPVAAGTVLMLMLASANTDPATPGADAVDLTRGDKRHLAFGGGPHRCLGSHLARMELRVVVREWHKRIPEYRLKEGTTVTWNSSFLRGIDHLELEWDVAGAGS